MSKLIEYRNEIDAIDTSIITLLAERFSVVKKVGEYKKEHNLPPLQPTRWQEVLDSRKAQAKELGISPECIQKIWNTIHEYALELEEKSV